MSWRSRGVQGRWDVNKDGTRIRAYTKQAGPQIGSGGNVLKIRTLSGITESVHESRFLSRLLNFSLSGTTHRTVQATEVEPGLFQVSMRFRLDADSTQQYMPIGEASAILIRSRHGRELEMYLRRLADVESVLLQMNHLDDTSSVARMLHEVRVPETLRHLITSS